MFDHEVCIPLKQAKQIKHRIKINFKPMNYLLKVIFLFYGFS